eukprot:CAMPEP_0184505812 /NCGR_PEP_ID=MMETSP0113_2-20130426/53177_1 /TAXON_ID=91329 /ORGANISM="Norrisiella sphaerica, Strain BC52" /LENGTH=139 /DNA_ID=CAMNT_0026895511 /DNA_START=993 /DNA_END=1412 /DNA_ORIENTATION=+
MAVRLKTFLSLLFTFVVVGSVSSVGSVWRRGVVLDASGTAGLPKLLFNFSSEGGEVGLCLEGEIGLASALGFEGMMDTMITMMNTETTMHSQSIAAFPDHKWKASSENKLLTGDIIYSSALLIMPMWPQTRGPRMAPIP